MTRQSQGKLRRESGAPGKKMELIQTWVDDLKTVVGDERLLVSDVRIGVFYTAARLSTGHVGVAFTPRDVSDTVCCPRTAAAAPPAGRVAGQPAWALTPYALTGVPLRRAVGVAVLNALSALAIERHGVPGGRLLPRVDALTAAEVCAEDRVLMIGGFVPFIRALKGQVTDLWIVDKHPEALKPDERKLWRAPDRIADLAPAATVVIATGSALIEGGLEELLTLTRGLRRFVLAGPTASPWPPPFFARGVHVLGGIRVRDPDKMLQVVSEGGSGYFFEDFSEKVCIVRNAAEPAGAAAV
jgi:uncharacterized protein (DUF4213/DUF364 family)